MTVPLMPERDIGRTSHFNRTDLRPAHYRPDALAYGRVDTAAALLRTISTLNNLSPRPDLVVISGDITDSALPEEYAHAQSCLVLCRCHSWQFLAITIAAHLSAKRFPILPVERQTVHSIRCVASTNSIFS